MKPTILVMTLLFGFAAAAQADNFRCPNGAIVSTGDSMSQVYIECDPPSFKNTRTESESGYRGATILINVEEWTYNEGPTAWYICWYFVTVSWLKCRPSATESNP